MKQPPTYIAPHIVYTGGELYRPGQPFTTDAPPGAAWELVSPAKKYAGAAKAEREENTQ